ncbi:hypothetical protein EPUS_00214 [Endocarpon pusillum Z07020]|uniref:5-Methylcytosine G/T mismatch-specific DNA glycosylase n=1 Tax=Endocarpon pusillum (strain Z07020 / HMAS-L-300199) TaxID=1263415 RepID=U1GTS3_ENDPU|nr:uncharacterized protein EPUS_00214 [Endocarpon pusillum Z07020]ERF75421.1 hypothetical protein EPUS_00214 [Endocarpon pusillum Z07020]
MPSTLDTDQPVTGAGLESKTSLPYPTFSKAHSKEAVGARDALKPTLNIFTPDPTDLSTSKDKQTSREAAVGGAPPSPPLTSVDQHGGGSRSGSVKRTGIETIEEEKKSQLDRTVKVKLRPKSSRSNGHLQSTSELGSPTKSPLRSKQSTPLKSKMEEQTKRSVSQPTKAVSPPPSSLADTELETTPSSNATSIAPNQPRIQRPGSQPPPVTVEDDMISQVTSIPDGGVSRGPTPLEAFVDDRRTPASSLSTHPPPPPPPPLAPITQPKVDYLLQHGGLNQSVPKNLLLAGKHMAIQQSAPAQPAQLVANLFEPYNRLLDDYKHVVSKNGSLAVATGYRSVARRLLDRLEAVFARDISSETCQCCLCASVFDDTEDSEGVSWGEILELVAGRRDLPSWPPFSLANTPRGLGISLEAHTPMQKLDIDVPEEFRDHYIRQSRKTKQSVDKWLSRQTDSPTNPPEEVDDETLTFAILTHLGPEQRPSFSNLLGIVNTPLEPPKRMPSPQRGPTPQPAPTPQPRYRPQPIVTASRAVQRLYRLASPPRDPETAIYLLYNPSIHNALATLAAVSDDEWEILISGRFDGFLRSGADDPLDIAQPPGRQTPLRSVNSRGPIPLLHGNSQTRPGTYMSRAATPASGAHYGAPIAYDEETEIATLAEIERDIYSGMEALEDAFEALHVKAEMVRQALRERGAGLASMQQRRRGGLGDGIEVRMGTPASGIGIDGRWEAETDDGLGEWEGISELAPDDSASNISSSRRRRPKRRNERRTPALVEEDEDLGESEGTASPRKK